MFSNRRQNQNDTDTTAVCSRNVVLLSALSGAPLAAALRLCHALVASRCFALVLVGKTADCAAHADFGVRKLAHSLTAMQLHIFLIPLSTAFYSGYMFDDVSSFSFCVFVRRLPSLLLSLYSLVCASFRLRVFFVSVIIETKNAA